jgi:hypothetical protein
MASDDGCCDDVVCESVRIVLARQTRLGVEGSASEL